MTDEKEEKKKHKLFHGSLYKEDGPFRNYINILIGYIDTMVLYNFFFIGVSLVIITIGPALVGMNACFNDFIGNNTERRYRKFFQKFKENFSLANVLAGLLLVIVLAFCVYMALFCAQNYGHYLWLTVPWVLVHFLAIYAALVFAYYALMKVRMDLPTRTIVKNAFVLASGAVKPALMSLLSFGVLFLVPLIFLEYTIPLFVLLEFSWVTLSMMMTVYTEVDKYVIYNPEKEEEELKKKEEEDIPHLRLDLIPEKPKKAKKNGNGSSKNDNHVENK